MSTSVWTSVAFSVLASLFWSFKYLLPSLYMQYSDLRTYGSHVTREMAEVEHGGSSCLRPGIQAPFIPSHPWPERASSGERRPPLEVVGACPSRLTSLLQTHDLC